MKYLLIWIASLGLFCSIQAQTMRDTVFNEVILIDKNNVTTDGYDFLIDIPIQPQKGRITIFNNDPRIPLKLFLDKKSFLLSQNEILLITPDWEYYNEIDASEKKTGYNLHPVRQNKLYYIERNNTGYKVDSLNVRMDDLGKPVTLKFKDVALKANEVKYYYGYCYGSTCCPRDIRWDLYENRQKNIEFFEKQNNVKITKDFYVFIAGEEGEHCGYYTLSNLSNAQKIAFLRSSKELHEGQLQETSKFPVLIAPAITETGNLMHKNP